MNSKQHIWQEAQIRERGYYEQRSQSLSADARSMPYTDIHRSFWRATLDLLPELTLSPSGVYYDIGCGPNTILSLVETGTRTGVDPLMDFYKSRFNLPEGIVFFQDQIEELKCLPDNSADIVFIMNCIDHVQSVDRAAETIGRKLKSGGYLVMSVNVVSSRMLHVLSRLTGLYRIIDPTHPHHFSSAGQLARKFARDFTPLKTLNIQYLADKLADDKKRFDAAQAPSIQACAMPAKATLLSRIVTKIHNSLDEELTLILFKRV